MKLKRKTANELLILPVPVSLLYFTFFKLIWKCKCAFYCSGCNVLTVSVWLRNLKRYSPRRYLVVWHHFCLFNKRCVSLFLSRLTVFHLTSMSALLRLGRVLQWGLEEWHLTSLLTAERRKEIARRKRGSRDWKAEKNTERLTAELVRETDRTL